MKNSLILLLILLTLISCTEEITVITSKQPGQIVGTVLPKDATAQIQLIQGEIVETTNTENGGFNFSDVAPGIYRLSITAENFGRQELDNIKVEDGEGNDIGIIQLSKYPYPLISTTPFNGAESVRAPSGYLQFEFSEDIDPSSLEQALKIEPKVIIDRLSFSNKKRFSFYTTFNFGTKYNITIDTTLVTEYGEHLEFPAEFVFTTIDFTLSDIRFPNLSRYSNDPLVLYFNGELNGNLKNIISVEPSISIETSTYGNSGIIITPTFGWMADTAFNIVISKSVEEINGATLKNDTTISFTTPELIVDETFPANGQYYVDTTSVIKVQTNYFLDEGSIKDAISISPNIDFQITTYLYSGRTEFRLYPSHLNPNTKYTIIVDKSLTDLYGIPLREDYSFSFTTKE